MLSDVGSTAEPDDIFIEVLLKDYALVFENKEPFSNNTEYMQFMELKFLLKNIRELTVRRLYDGFTQSGLITSYDDNSHRRKGVDLSDLAKRKDKLDSLLETVHRTVTHRLSGTDFVPRILQLCEHYRLSSAETTLVHLMTVVQGSTNPYVVNTLIEEDYFKRLVCFQRLSDMSESDVDRFCDPERAHLKEGLVTSEEDHGIHFNLRCSTTCVAVLYGRILPQDELLKVSQTALEDILAKEHTHLSSGHVSNTAGATGSVPTANGTPGLSSDGDVLVKKRKRSDGCSADVSVVQEDQSGSLVDDGDDDDDTSLVGGETDTLEFDTSTDVGPSTLGPYPSDDQLEYLEDGFHVVAVMVRANAARLKDDMKKEGTRMNSWDIGEVKGGRRELQAKYILLEKRMEKRMEATRALARHDDNGGMEEEAHTGGSALFERKTRLQRTMSKSSDTTGPPNLHKLPRLEIIAARLHLDNFEKKLILLLIGKTVSPVVKALIDTLEQGSGRSMEDVATVGQVLAILCQDFRTQIANRKYFYRSARLLSNGIISLSKSRWHQGSGDLTDQRVVLDRRVLDWVVGLDSEINELVEGSDLYAPKVSLEQVVLPKGQLGPVVKQCRAYDDFRKYRTDMGLEEVMCYGNSLVVLLCGKSGTGKTMTVNAIAHDLGKKVLLVDFGGLSGRREGAGELDADLRGLFREAHMSNAVLFFDECEAVFRSRDRGGERLLNALLTEIERHEGIVFLATNRPHDLDEAMHRRITCVVQFSSPDYNMRLRIWESLLNIKSSTACNEGIEFESTKPVVSGKSVRLAASSDVDLPALAIKYELTGGFIKNALLSALLSALHRRKYEEHGECEDGVVLTQADLEEGCKLQMRGSLSLKHLDTQKMPQRSVSSLALSSSIMECTRSILMMERARTLVHGAWGGIGDNTGRFNGRKQGSTSLPPADAVTNGSISGNGSGVGLVLEGEVETWSDTRRATISAFAGPVGSGKRSLVKAIAYDLNRCVQIVHVSDLLSGVGGGRKGGDLADTVDAVESLLQDARIADAVIGIDGFEHVLDDSSPSGDNGMKLSIVLCRLLEIFSLFPGLIILICHIDSPQNLILHKEFSSRIYSFARFTVPSSDIRSILWRQLTPHNAPVSSDIDYIELGRKFELGPGGISHAVSRACAVAVARIHKQDASTANEAQSRQQESTSCLCQKDFLQAGEAEVTKLKGGHIDILSKMFM